MPEVEIKTTRDLKQFMQKFGSLVAGMELIRIKEKKPDWPSIDLTVREMSAALESLQKADKTNAYKGFTDQLTAQMIVIKKLDEKKDSKIYEAFDKLTNTCFQCHAVHRPADFLKPKGGREISKEAPSKP